MRQVRAWLRVPIRLRWLDLRDGFRYGYPLCCTVRFALGSGAQAIQRGVRHPDDDDSHVPCNVFHRGVPWAELQDARLMMAYSEVDWDDLEKMWGWRGED